MCYVFYHDASSIGDEDLVFSIQTKPPPRAREDGYIVTAGQAQQKRQTKKLSMRPVRQASTHFDV